ncbi:MAG: ComEC family competence protein [bacterium ADurb.Bin400]|nr:MAG: ComEC family competence protein [bacterium ADurb.Bin400]
MRNPIPKHRYFTILSIAFLFGIFFASVGALGPASFWPVLTWVSGLLLLAGLWNWLYNNLILCVIAITLSFLALGGAVYNNFDLTTDCQLEFGREGVIIGEIISKPEVSAQKQKVLIKIHSWQQVVNAGNTDTVNPLCRRPNIMLYLPPYPTFVYGDVLEIHGVIAKPQPIESFDYPRYLKKYPAAGVIAFNVQANKLSAGSSVKVIIYRSLHQVSDRLEQSLNRLLPEPHASLSAGIIFGLRRNLPDLFEDKLAIVGLTHLIALSGFNVTIIIVFINALLISRFGRRSSLIIGSLLVIAFVILTGASPSITRAAIFSLLILLGKTIGRRGDQANLMLLAAVSMVALHPPLLVFDIGFQLSFLAFIGIIYLSPLIGNTLSVSRANIVPESSRSLLAETLGAQLAVLPLIIFVFGRVSFIAPLANLAVLWIIPPIMALSFLAALTGLVAYHAGKIVAYFLWPALEYVTQVVERFAVISPDTHLDSSVDVLFALAAWLIVIAFIIIRKRRN